MPGVFAMTTRPPLPGTPEAKTLGCPCTLGQPSGTNEERDWEHDFWRLPPVTVWIVHPECLLHVKQQAWCEPSVESAGN